MFPIKELSSSYSGLGRQVIECDGLTFLEQTKRVRWLTPRTRWEWVFGRQCTIWRCTKCGEEFVKKPSGKCCRLI